MDNKLLYQPDDIETMKWADQARMPGRNRMEEIRNFASKAGYKRLGIAHCVAFQKEANQMKDFLSPDFEVFTIDCKCGKIPAGELLESDSKGIICNPAGQADYLHENKTELNVVMGLCVGHDMVFTAKSKAPSTTLLVKDREHKNNPLESFK